MIKKFQRNNYLYNDIKNNKKENKYNNLLLEQKN